MAWPFRARVAGLDQRVLTTAEQISQRSVAADRLGARSVTEVLRKYRRRMSRTRARLRPRREHGHNGPYLTKENMIAKYLLLKHYRGGPAPAVDWAPMDQWTPDEVDAHV